MVAMRPQSKAHSPISGESLMAGPGSYIANIFGRSPVRPLQEHIAKAAACARELVPLAEAAQSGDWARANEVRETILRLEDEADLLKKDLRLNMPSSLLMPVARTDLLDLLMIQDKIANSAKDASGLIIGRRMRFPDSISADYIAFVRRCIDAVAQAEKSVNELDELYETGFRGAEAKIVESMIGHLDALENDTDRMQVDVRAQLFAMEKDLPPVDVVFMYKAIEWIGEVGDYAQRVGSRLLRLLAR
jgi:uncharacterized protein